MSSNINSLFSHSYNLVANSQGNDKPLTAEDDPAYTYEAKPEEEVTSVSIRVPLKEDLPLEEGIIDKNIFVKTINDMQISEEDKVKLNAIMQEINNMPADDELIDGKLLFKAINESQISEEDKSKFIEIIQEMNHE